MRRFLILAMLSFVGVSVGVAAPNNLPIDTDVADNTRAILPYTLNGKGGGVALPSVASIVPTGGVVTCLANGHVAIDGADQGSSSVCTGNTEVSCKGGIHIVLNSSSCLAG